MKKIFAWWVAWVAWLPLFAQRTDSNLAKGKELVLAEEYRSAYFFLQQAMASRKSNSREEAVVTLAELFQLQHLPDSSATLLKNLEKKKEKSSVQVAFALQQLAEEKPDKAYEELLLALKKINQADMMLAAKVNYYAGLIHYRKRTTESFPMAIAYWETAIRQLKKDSAFAHLRLASIRWQLGDTYRLDGQPEKALAQTTLALEILKRSPYTKPSHLAAAYGIEGRAYATLKHYTKARTALEHALEMQIKSGADSASVGATWANLGLCFDELHDLTRCEDAYDRVARYWRKGNTPYERVATFTNNQSVFLQSIHESASALQGLEQVLAQIESGKVKSPFTIYQTYYNLAFIHYDIEDYAGAKKYFDQLDVFFERNPNAVSLVEKRKFLLLKAKWLRKVDRLEEALSLCRQIEKEIEEDSFTEASRASFYTTYGDILMSADRFDECDGYLCKSKKLYDALGDISKRIELNNLMAINFFQMRKADSTIRYAKIALQLNGIENSVLLYPFIEPQSAIQSCYIIMAAIAADNSVHHTLDDALPYEELGINLIRAIRKNLYNDADRVTYNRSVTAFYNLLAILYYQRWQLKQEGALARFFEYVEESKFQALANSLSRGRVNSFKEVNEALVSEEKNLAKRKVLRNKQLIQLVTQSEGEEELEQRTRTAKDELVQLEKRHGIFLDSIRRNFSGYYELKYGSDPVSLADFQRELSPGQVAIQLKVTDSLILVQGISKKAVSLISVSQVPEWKRKLLKVRNLIQFKMADEFPALAHDVFTKLVQPLLEEQKKKGVTILSLLIIPDDFFYALPFETLVTRTQPVRYLIHEYEITYAYSANLDVQQRRHQQEVATGTFLGIAPKFSNALMASSTERSALTAAQALSYDEYGFQPLKENENEINLIGSLVEQNAVPRVLLSGESASEDKIKKLDLSHFQFIHFATHGFVNSSDPALSGLALTNSGNREDNILYTSEIYRLTMNAELVCLSACETGLGQQSSGEGLMGLGRAFLYAGARNLLVSLWKVPDESTSELMVDFYRTLFLRKKLSGSLRQAKLEMLKNPAYQSPFYWAPFVLIGR